LITAADDDFTSNPFYKFGRIFGDRFASIKTGTGCRRNAYLVQVGQGFIDGLEVKLNQSPTFSTIGFCNRLFYSLDGDIAWQYT